ncbi:hypothetical protein [Streptomyces shenzhenensis]
MTYQLQPISHEQHLTFIASRHHLLGLVRFKVGTGGLGLYMSRR